MENEEFKPDRKSPEYNSILQAIVQGMFVTPRSRPDLVAREAFAAADAFAREVKKINDEHQHEGGNATPETGHRPEPGPSTPQPGSGNPGGTAVDPSSGAASTPNPPGNPPPEPPKGPIDAQAEEGKNEQEKLSGNQKTEGQPDAPPPDTAADGHQDDFGANDNDPSRKLISLPGEELPPQKTLV